MDVRLSEEQLALRKAVCQAMDRLRPRALPELDDASRSARLEEALNSTGWRQLRAGGEGGLPFTSPIEPAIVAGELGRAAADVGFVGATLAAEVRRLAGLPEGPDREVVAFTTDLSVPAVAPGGALARAALAFDSAEAKSALVLVPVADGYRLAACPVTAGTGTVDLTRQVARIDAQAPATALTEQSRTLTDSDLTRWTAFGLALTCADLVGVMAGTTALACDYAKVRRQYGAAIGSFQAVAHLLAEAKVATEGSRSIALHAAWAADALPASDALAAAAAAKAYCSRAARTVCETSIQVHGGIGNTWECFAHVYLRRALLSIDLLGGVGPNLRRVQDHYGIGAASGLR
jgi:hypothetical protein